MLISNSHSVMPVVSRRVMRPYFAILVVSGICLMGVMSAARGDDARPAAGAHRASGQILADIQSAFDGLPKYRMVAQLDPRARQQMTREMGPPLQHLMELFTELEKVDRARAVPLRAEKCLAQVRLALYGYDDTLKSLTDASNSAVPSDALFGKVGLMMYRWWNPGDTAAQKEIVAEFATLAKANPKDDMLVGAALTMARYRAASDDLAASLREIVDQDLTGSAAEKYHHQAYKLGKPLNITIKGMDGKLVSTGDWKGKVIVIDFWATWCRPCVAALPKLVQLYQTNRLRGLEILGISNDTSLPTLKEFLANHKEMVWPESFNPVGQEPWNALSSQMGIRSIPTAFLIDRNGILRDIEQNYLDEEMVNKLLDEPVKLDAASGASAKSEPAPQPAANSEGASERAAMTTAADPGEKQAEAMLSLANSYIANKRPHRAVENLNQLVEKYPNSAAARKAKELLVQLNKQ